MPAFSPTIGKFGDVTARGKPWTLWYKKHKQKMVSIVGACLAVILLVAGWWVWQGQMVPASGGVLDEGIVGQPQLLNPLFNNPNDAGSEISPLLFRGLLKYDDSFQLVNDLAQSIDYDEEAASYTITLGDHSWHDGTPVTAADVAFTIKSTQDQAYTGPWEGSFTGVNIQIIDESSLTLTLDEPYAPFEHNLTIGLLPEHLLGGKTAEQLATDPFNRAPIGTGKLSYVATTAGEDPDMVASMRFALADGYVDAVEFHFYPTLAEAVTAFKLGRLDALGSQYTNELDSLEDFDHNQESVLIAGQSHGLYFNLSQPSVNDLQVRQALAHSLDKQHILQKVFGEYATPMNNVYNSNHWAYAEGIEYLSVDHDAAKRLWAEAENTPERIRLLVPDRDVQLELAKEIALGWEALGTKVTIISEEGSRVAEIVQSGQGYDVAMLGEKMRPDPDRYSNWHSTQAPPIGLNVSRLSNDRIDKALEDARVLRDVEERKTKYATFQDYLNRELPVIWLYQPHYIYIWGNKVHGVSIDSMWHETDRFNSIEQWYVNLQRRNQ